MRDQASRIGGCKGDRSCVASHHEVWRKQSRHYLLHGVLRARLAGAAVEALRVTAVFFAARAERDAAGGTATGGAVGYYHGERTGYSSRTCRIGDRLGRTAGGDLP